MASAEPFRPRTLSELVDEERIRTGDIERSAEALTDGTISLSWGDYVGRVARMAAVLVGEGVATGTRVGVRLPKSVDSFVAVHAVLRAGAVMVPLDPLAPAAHGASVLADAGVEVLIAAGGANTAALVAAAPGLRSVVLPLSDGENVLELRPDVRVVGRDVIEAAAPIAAVGVDPNDAAYVIYTSGSTGRPKGIVHTHASAMAYATTAAEVYGLTANDRLANLAPLHFDQSTFELYAAPLVGAAVLVVPDPVLRFPASLSALIAAQRVTVWYSVPFLLTELSSRGALGDRDLSSLRWVLFGGESFPPGQLATLMRQLPAATFSNVYGPAEVNQCTVHHLSEPPPDDVPVPIGVAWPAAELRVVDPDDVDAPVPPGVAGLLLVKSPTMMSGYWNRDDLTAASTIERRNAAGGLERWYNTGDLVLERNGGRLVFQGRVDNQVKLRGHRIELEAIDAALADLEVVKEATAVVERRHGGDDRLIALVLLAETAVASPAIAGEILSVLRQRLPKYAVPAEVVPVEALPRTSTGKIDRNAARLLIDSPHEQ